MLRLSQERPREWLTIAVHRDDARVRSEPFAAFELDLSILRADVQL